MSSKTQILSFKTKLDPNNVQKTLLSKAAGTARFAYNWGLNYQNENRSGGTGSYISNGELNKIFNKIKKEEFPWTNEITKCSPQQALKDLDNAFKRFFDKKGGYPKFKKKGEGDSFYCDGTIRFERNSILIPKIGLIRIHEDISQFIDFKPKSVRIVKQNYDWFVTFFYEVDLETASYPKDELNPIVGCDLGIKSFATLSDGKEFETPKKYNDLNKQLIHLQRKLARQVKVEKIIKDKDGNDKTVKVDSNNRTKTKEKLSRLHGKIKNQRKDATNKLTTHITKNHSVVGIEDLNVKGMLRNHKLARSIANSNFGEIRRQLEYKGKLYGCEIIIIDTFYPSSKRCSCCGNLKDKLSLSTRTYSCECGNVMDRDLNASLNLRQEAIRLMELKRSPEPSA